MTFVGRVLQAEFKSNTNDYLLDPRNAEAHLWTHVILNLEADELQQQKTALVSTRYSEEQESEATVHVDYPNWTTEEC